MAAGWMLGEDRASRAATLAARVDLERTAAVARALLRRRGIDGAATLLRLGAEAAALRDCLHQPALTMGIAPTGGWAH